MSDNDSDMQVDEITDEESKKNCNDSTSAECAEQRGKYLQLLRKVEDLSKYLCFN